MRTVEDFVTEMICKDRTLEQIRCVALGCRFSNALDLVEKTYNDLCAPLQKDKEVA